MFGSENTTAGIAAKEGGLFACHSMPQHARTTHAQGSVCLLENRDFKTAVQFSE